MVLDGQQRLQSLPLALGGDSLGFRKAREGKRSSHRWSHASLCLDLERFLAQYSKADQNLEDVDFRDLLVWTIVDRTTGQSKKVRP